MDNIRNVLHCLDGVSWNRVPKDRRSVSQLRLNVRSNYYLATDVSGMPALESMKSLVLQTPQHQFTTLTEVYMDDSKKLW
jgi:hypothetical protein